MKAALVATCVALVVAPLLQAQEAELSPIVVTGTFELNPQPSVTDRFTQHLLKQFETKLAFEALVLLLRLEILPDAAPVIGE